MINPILQLLYITSVIITLINQLALESAVSSAEQIIQALEDIIQRIKQWFTFTSMPGSYNTHFIFIVPHMNIHM